MTPLVPAPQSPASLLSLLARAETLTAGVLGRQMWTVWTMLCAALMAVLMSAKEKVPAQIFHDHGQMQEDKRGSQPKLIITMQMETRIPVPVVQAKIDQLTT